MKYLLLLGLLISSQATAVVYNFTGTSWKQLQNPTTYETVCQTGNPCDVPAGVYNLVDFATSPATVSQVTIDSDTSSDESVLVTEECDYEISNTGRGCTAQCPEGKTIKRIRACSAAGIGSPRPPIGTSFSSTDSWALCQVGPFLNALSIVIQLECE